MTAHRAGLVLIVLMFASAFVLLWLTSDSSVTHLMADLLVAYCLGWGLYVLLSKESQVEVRRRFLLMTISLFVMLGILEVPAVTDLVDYRVLFSTPVKEAWRHPRNVPDERAFFWTHRPKQRVHWSYMLGDIRSYLCLPPGTGQFELAVDHYGFRNETDLTRAHIAVIGDSLIEGLDVAIDPYMTNALALSVNGSGLCVKKAYSRSGLCCKARP